MCKITFACSVLDSFLPCLLVQDASARLCVRVCMEVCTLVFSYHDDDDDDDDDS